MIISANEKLLTLGGNTEPKYGNILILAGGGGSGKDWSFNNIIGFKGRMVNVDDISGEISSMLQKNPSTKFKDKIIEYIDSGDWKKYTDSDNLTPEYIDSLIERLDKERNPKEDSFFDGKNDQDVSFRYRFVNYYDYHNKVQSGTGKAASKDRLPNLIVNTTLGQYGKIGKVAKFANEYGYKPEDIHIVWVLTPLPEAQDRNSKRKRSINPDLIEMGHKAVYKTFRKIFGIDPLKDLEKSVSEYIDGDIWIVFASLSDTGVITKEVPDRTLDGEIKTDKDGNQIMKQISVVTSYTACKIKSKGEPIVPLSQVPDLPLVGGNKGMRTVGDLLDLYSGGEVKEMREYTEAKARNMKKIKAALSGSNDLIKTWGIITAENPLGLDFSSDINAKRDKDLRTKLAQSNLEYIKVKGQYGNPENSLFIINPSLSDLEKIASDFCQEFFIFATNTKDGDFSFDAGYYETDIPDFKKENIKKKLQNDPSFKAEPMKYRKSITKKNIIDQKDADDFFTSIDTHGRKFKFQIPFFESTIRRAYERMSMCTEGKDLDHVKYEIKRTTIEADQYTAGSRWRIRGSLYHQD